jgi:2,4-dienoyl-CoA reductase-like NADH-dependent reductase (Old Yellow Enzyme family)
VYAGDLHQPCGDIPTIPQLLSNAVPPMVVTYYAQRASAGLLITGSHQDSHHQAHLMCWPVMRQSSLMPGDAD